MYVVNRRKIQGGLVEQQWLNQDTSFGRFSIDPAAGTNHACISTSKAHDQLPHLAFAPLMAYQVKCTDKLVFWPASAWELHPHEEKNPFHNTGLMNQCCDTLISGCPSMGRGMEQFQVEQSINATNFYIYGRLSYKRKKYKAGKEAKRAQCVS